MKKEYLETGKIVSAHGIRGDVKVMPWCDSPAFLCGFRRLFLNGGKDELSVEKARVQKNMVLIKLEGVDTADDAAALRGKILYLKRADAALPDDLCFVQDLLGAEALDADTGRSYGRVTDVLETGANDVYELTDDTGRVRLVPAIDDVLIESDLEAGILKIRPLRGLFEDED